MLGSAADEPKSTSEPLSDSVSVTGPLKSRLASLGGGGGKPKSTSESSSDFESLPVEALTVMASDVYALPLPGNIGPDGPKSTGESSSDSVVSDPLVASLGGKSSFSKLPEPNTAPETTFNRDIVSGSGASSQGIGEDDWLLVVVSVPFKIADQQTKMTFTISVYLHLRTHQARDL